MYSLAYSSHLKSKRLQKFPSGYLTAAIQEIVKIENQLFYDRSQKMLNFHTKHLDRLLLLLSL
jgi:hypothetical protein